MQTPVIGKCEDNRGVENASPHFYLLRHHIFLLQKFAFSDFYKLMVWGGIRSGSFCYSYLLQRSSVSKQTISAP